MVVLGHCRDIQWLSTAGIFCGSALHGYPWVGHDAVLLDLTGIFCGSALHGYPGYSAVGLCAGSGENIDSLKSNNLTVRAGKKHVGAYMSPKPLDSHMLVRTGLLTFLKWCEKTGRDGLRACRQLR